jgi:hypothetical protein
MLSRAYGLDRDLGGKGTSPDAEIWRSLEAVLSGLPENLVRLAYPMKYILTWDLFELCP